MSSIVRSLANPLVESFSACSRRSSNSVLAFFLYSARLYETLDMQYPFRFFGYTLSLNASLKHNVWCIYSADFGRVKPPFSFIFCSVRKTFHEILSHRRHQLGGLSFATLWYRATSLFFLSRSSWTVILFSFLF